MIKILLVTMNKLNAVDFYRTFGALAYLYKLTDKVQIDRVDNITWDVIIGYDILFMCRPIRTVERGIIKAAKEMNIKTWVDYDDLLHDLPEYNPAFNYYNDKDIRNNITDVINIADFVTVSTQKLKDYYGHLNKNIMVVENAHNDYLYPLKRIDNKNQIVNWRGSFTHRGDLYTIRDQLINIAGNNKDWVFSFIGTDLWYMTEYIENHIFYEGCDINIYFEIIKKTKPSINIFPLVKNPFNEAKSNISWLEGVYSGSVMIAPDLPEFNKPGVITYNSPEKFSYYLEKALKSQSFRKENYNKSFDYITENLLLSNVNKKRLEVIECLMSV